jgi:hypothetical protein
MFQQLLTPVAGSLGLLVALQQYVISWIIPTVGGTP